MTFWDFVDRQFGKGILVIVVIIFIAGIWIGSQYLNPSNGTGIVYNNLGNPEESKKPSPENNTNGNPSCAGEPILFNSSDWDINLDLYNAADKDGYYCPKNTSYNSPNIWYKDLIPTQFQSFYINFFIKNKDSKRKEVPQFVFSLGKSPEILRLYLPQAGNNGLIGFQKLDLNTGSLVWESPEKLDEPINVRFPAEVKIRSFVEREGHANFAFVLKYTSTDGSPVTQTINKDFDIPSTNLQNNIGFATFEESCIKPTSYYICY